MGALGLVSGFSAENHYRRSDIDINIVEQSNAIVLKGTAKGRASHHPKLLPRGRRP